MEDAPKTVEEQDARLAAHTEKLRAENEARDLQIEQLEALLAQQRESILELEEAIAHSREKN